PGCPQFGDSTVLNRPPEYADECSVMPGLHFPKTGMQPVVWFDPQALRLKAQRAEGVENEQVLQGTGEQGEEGFQRYHEWKDARAAIVEAGSVPRYRAVLAERFGMAEEAAGIAVETVTLEAPDGRPSGRKFGRLVHDILQRAERASEIE